MSAVILPESESLRLIYREILDGCSLIAGYFVKHLSEVEQIELVRKRIEFIDHYIQEGIPTETERMTRLRQDGEWSDEKDADILAYRQTIADNERILSNVISQQQEGIRSFIQKHREELYELLKERKLLLGTTAEELADRDNIHYMAYLSLFKDRQCVTPLFNTWQDFEGLDEEVAKHYLDSIDEVMSKFREENVRRIAALPFFLNLFSYSKEDISTFLNRPVSQLTQLQAHLFSLGVRNLSILSQSETSPPEYFENVKADELVQWYDTQYSVILGKRKQANHS